jgi:hypothetical protein
LFAGLEVKGTQGPHVEEKKIEHPWWKVMCLTAWIISPHLATSRASPS